MGALTTFAESSVARLTEDELIRRVVTALADAAPAFPEGPGGDCAHLPGSSGCAFRVSSIDSVILGRHFDASCEGNRAGRKLVNRNLSDLASAGAIPSDALLSLILGPDVDLAWLTDFVQGVGRAAHKAHLKIVGGDICSGIPGTCIGTLAIQGFADRILTRRFCTSGNVLFVTGELGGSISGRHLDFTPRLAEGKWLCKQPEVTACTDLSDGLAKDLPNLIGSQLDAYIHSGGLPVSPATLSLAQSTGRTITEHALQDGEDYELLFAVAALCADLLATQFRKAFPHTRLTRIGEIKAGNGIIRDITTGRTLIARGFSHFA